MSPAITLTSKPPVTKAFKALRDSAGWGEISLAQAELALAQSLASVSAYKNGRLIAMARLIGDGVLNAYIQDVVVAENHRGQGIGRAILTWLIVDMRRDLPLSCTIGLMAAKGQEGFYQSFRFIPRPDTDYGAGMFATLADLTDGTLA